MRDYQIKVRVKAQNVMNKRIRDAVRRFEDETEEWKGENDTLLKKKKKRKKNGRRERNTR